MNRPLKLFLSFIATAAQFYATDIGKKVLAGYRLSQQPDGLNSLFVTAPMTVYFSSNANGTMEAAYDHIHKLALEPMSVRWVDDYMGKDRRYTAHIAADDVNRVIYYNNLSAEQYGRHIWHGLRLEASVRSKEFGKTFEYNYSPFIEYPEYGFMAMRLDYDAPRATIAAIGTGYGPDCRMFSFKCLVAEELFFDNLINIDSVIEDIMYDGLWMLIQEDTNEAH